MSQEPSQISHHDASQQELEKLELQARMDRIGWKILVLSGKGGVGKSTVAANLATLLARAGKEVGLLDIDVHGPSIPKLLGLEGRRPLSNELGLIPIQVAGNLKVMSIGFLLDSGVDAVIWRGPMKYGVIRQFLKDVAWGQLDYLVIDSPPGTGDEPLAVAQLVGKPAAAVIVTTPQDLAVADVRRSISFCNALHLPVLGVIENMSGLVCPHCGRELELFKVGGGERLAKEMDVPFLGRIPLDPQIVASSDTGQTFVRTSADSPASKAFARIIAPILSRPKEDKSLYPTHERKENEKMKIAIPIADGKVCMHFGHCEQFALVEVDADSKTILSTSYLVPPPHEPGVLPRWLHEQGADVIIAGGMGQRAQGLFSRNGIKVVVGAPAERHEDVLSAYLSGTLRAGPNVCDH